MWTIWSRRREFWRRIPTASYVTFLAGIFLMFMSGGLLDDLSNLGSNPPSRLVAGMMISGGLTVAYVLAFRWPRWLVGVIAIHAMVEELSTPQVPLAIFGDRSFVAARAACCVGDLFVILTDGLTEVFDSHDREFGLDEVKALVQAHGASPLDRLEHTLLDAVRAHGSQLDDQTVLLIRVVA